MAEKWPLDVNRLWPTENNNGGEMKKPAAKEMVDDGYH